MDEEDPHRRYYKRVLRLNWDEIKKKLKKEYRKIADEVKNYFNGRLGLRYRIKDFVYKIFTGKSYSQKKIEELENILKEVLRPQYLGSKLEVIVYAEGAEIFIESLNPYRPSLNNRLNYLPSSRVQKPRNLYSRTS